MLFDNNRRIYSAEDSQAIFPIGGIGTGTISMNSRGRLQDFEIFNKPDKGNEQPYTFFAIRSEDESGKHSAKVLEAELRQPYEHSHGFHAWNFSGAPRFRDSKFKVEYPIANLKLEEEDYPLEVCLEAFSPFVPLNSNESGIPAIYFTWKVKNTSNSKQKVCIALSAANLAGWTGRRDVFSKALYEDGSINELYNEDDFTSILMYNENIPDTSTDYTEMGIAVIPSEQQNVQSKELWQEGQWWDGMQDFWNDFSESGVLRNSKDLVDEATSVHHSPFTIGSLSLDSELEPGESSEFKFIYTWYHPNRARSWPQNNQHRDSAKDGEDAVVKNYYAQWGKPKELLRYLTDKFTYYREIAQEFAETWYSSNVPEPILDAVATNLTTIRSQTCFRVENGNFYAWEGNFDFEGSCPGNCTHVWNYAQSLAYFFPDLERSMRETEYFTELRPNGKMNFRAITYLDGFSDDYHPASDGQLGSAVRVYREWKISGDNKWLEGIWPELKRSIEFAKTTWDLDGDGILEAMQHNTYDIEFYGVSTLANSIWITALAALAEMADFLGEPDYANWAKETERNVSKYLDENCFNCEYYIQNIDDIDKHKYQYGNGCLADQLLGVTWAKQLGLKISLKEENIKSAVYSIYKYNLIDELRKVDNLQRGYAFNDESGLVLCAWPKGGKPRIPFVYSDEVWPGVEYSVASLLISCGYINEAVDLIEKLRARFNGKNRNPWNEMECGHHYARSLASFGPYQEYIGLKLDLVNETIKLRPQNLGKYFVLARDAWGIVDVESLGENLTYQIDSKYGDLSKYKFEFE